MARQLIVFIDYMNTYKSARDAFGFEGLDQHWEGQVHPRTLGELIAERHKDAELKQVRVYRGKPSNQQDPKGYAAFQRQQSVWEKTNLVEVITRDLRYPKNGQKPEEKGIDVLIALDFLTMAQNGEYEIGVLFSHDTDLVPALEQVTDLGTVELAVCAWEPDDAYGHRLRLKGQPLRCHWIPRVDYVRVRDGRDYNTKRTVY
jgi:uncharacterized LabA/DUF88 family protein